MEAFEKRRSGPGKLEDEQIGATGRGGEVSGQLGAPSASLTLTAPFGMRRRVSGSYSEN